MNKKICQILCAGMIFFPVSAFANTLTPPSLLDMIQVNNEREQERHEEEKRREKNQEKNIQEENNFTYNVVFSTPSISIKKANETGLYIQEIQLNKGARVVSALEKTGYNPESGEPQFQKKTLPEVVNSYTKQPTSVINGQFFNPRTQPSELSFGLKSRGVVVSAGADNQKERKNILYIREKEAQIVPYSWKNLKPKKGDESFAIVNLTLSEKRHTDENIGRTYMCLKNPNSQNISSTLLVFVAEAMSEPVIEKEIFKQGCTIQSTSKLDSSGSSRLWFDNNFIYGFGHSNKADKRKIPHSVLFYEK